MVNTVGHTIELQADVPKLILTQHWYVVRCGSMNRHQQDICLKEIGLRAQDMRVMLGHTRHDSEDLCDHLINMKTFTLMMKKDIHLSFKNHEESCYDLDLDFASHLIVIACSITYKKWAN